MARKAQADIDLDQFLAGADYHDIIIFSFQEAKGIDKFQEKIS